MASDKQRRKAAKAKQPKKPGPFRHPDGDRRHREAMKNVRQLTREQELLRMLGAVELPPETDDDAEEKAV